MNKKKGMEELYALEAKKHIRITSMICATIIAIMSIISFSWGKKGIEILGLICLGAAFIAVFIFGSARVE